MVVHVAEVRSNLLVDELMVTARQAVDRMDERCDRVVQLQHLPLQFVDALRRVHS